MEMELLTPSVSRTNSGHNRKHNINFPMKEQLPRRRQTALCEQPGRTARGGGFMFGQWDLSCGYLAAFPTSTRRSGQPDSPPRWCGIRANSGGRHVYGLCKPGVFLTARGGVLRRRQVGVRGGVVQL